MEKSKVLKPNEINWEPHPQLANAKVAYLLSQRDEKADLTCLLVHLPAGTEVEKHTHDESEDIVYVVKGKGKMWIEEVGDVPMVEGTFIRIPKGVLHQPGHNQGLIFLLLFKMGGDDFFQVAAIFLRNFHKADTHTNGGIVALYAVEIRPLRPDDRGER
jgi:quercetin dioxygenase-like cupin family protein